MIAPYLMQSRLVQTLGLTLLHSIWEIAAVAFVLFLSRLTLRKQGAQTAYLCACAAMALAVFAPAITFIMLQQSKPQPSVPSMDNAVTSFSISQPTLAQPEITQATPTTSRFSLQDYISSITQRAITTTNPALPWLVLAWSIGVLILSIWNLGGLLSLRKLKRQTLGPADDSIRSSADHISRKLGMKNTVIVLQSPLIDSPLVIGIAKPLILLPISIVVGLPPDELESILAHELAHVARRDYLVNLLQIAVETLLFYHPAIWWISSRIRAERENCCDDIAIALTQNRPVYVRALAAVAGARSPSHVPAANGGSLLNRIRRILGTDQTTSSSRWLAGALALLLCLATVLTTNFQSRARAADAVADTPQARFFYAGQVVDERGKPIANVAVTTTGRFIEGGMEYIDQTTTDSSGNFKIDRTRAISGQYPKNLGSTIIRIEFKHPNFCYARLEDVRALPPNQTGNLHIALRDGQRLLGRVLDPAGVGVSGALVQAVFDKDDDDFRKAVLTDQQGYFGLQGLPSEVAKIQAILADPKSTLLSGQTTVDLNKKLTDIPTIQTTPIVFGPDQPIHTLFGMKLVDANKELQDRFFLYWPRSVVILDPGPNIDRLHIDNPHCGDAIWLVGDKHVANFKEFATQLLAECEAQQKAGKHDYSCRIVYEYKQIDSKGSDTEYMRLTDQDVQELRRDVAMLNPVGRVRHFVRIVIEPNRIAFEGQETDWDRLSKLLEAIPNRDQTVLELAVSSDSLTVRQFDEAQYHAATLSQQFGFEYLSYIGQHPAGSKGSPDKMLEPSVVLAAPRADGAILGGKPPTLAEAYGVPENQVIKRVPPPFPAVRAEFVHSINPYITWVPVGMIVWTDGNRKGGTWSQGPMRMSDLLQYVLNVYPQEVEGDLSVASIPIAGDILLRGDPKKIDPEQLRVGVMNVIQQALGYPITLTFRQVPQSVIVLSGKWNAPNAVGMPFVPAAGEKQREIEIYGKELNRDRSVSSGGAGGSSSDFSQWLGQWIKQEVVINATGMPEDFRLYWNCADASDCSPDSQAHARDLVLQHITEQTGLTWHEETRTVRRLFLAKG